MIPLPPLNDAKAAAREFARITPADLRDGAGRTFWRQVAAGGDAYVKQVADEIKRLQPKRRK